MDLLDAVRDAHRREQVALEVDRALDVGLGEVEGGRIAYEPNEGLRPVDDDRAHRLAAAERHATSVPETERETGLEVTEEAVEDGRRPAGGDVP